MSDRRSTSPVAPSPGPTSSATPRRDGAVLRDVPFHREPRLLSTPRERQRGQLTSDRDRGALGPGSQAPGDESLAAEAASYRASAEEAGAYQRGYQAGRGDAEAELRAAQESALQQGWQAGFEKGVREGLAQGRADGQREAEREVRAAQEIAAQRLGQVDALLAGLEQELSRRLAAAEEEMVALCHAVVCRILGDQLVTRAGVAQCVVQALREASRGSMLDAAGQNVVAIHVHPRDLALLQSERRPDEDGGAALPGAASARWVADERVVLGGCLVRTTDGTLDARLETQLEALHELLRGARSVEGAGRGAESNGPVATGPGGPG